MTLIQDPNDKYREYEVDFHGMEEEPKNTTEQEHKEWSARHHDQVLEHFCDTHPSAPQCKVFDD